MDFKVENFVKNLYYTVDNRKIDDLGLLTNNLYINIDNIQNYSSIKLVSAITNLKNNFINKNINLSIYKNSK